MQSFGLGPALLEGVLAGLGLAVQLVLAFFMILLVAPDLAALLHLRAAEGGQERDEGGEAAHHVWGGCATRARRSDSRAVRRAAHHPVGQRLAAARPPVTWICESALA